MRMNSPTALENAWCVMKGYGLPAPIGGVPTGWSTGFVGVRRPKEEDRQRGHPVQISGQGVWFDPAGTRQSTWLSLGEWDIQCVLRKTTDERWKPKGQGPASRLRQRSC